MSSGPVQPRYDYRFLAMRGGQLDKWRNGFEGTVWIMGPKMFELDSFICNNETTDSPGRYDNLVSKINLTLNTEPYGKTLLTIVYKQIWDDYYILKEGYSLVLTGIIGKGIRTLFNRVNWIEYNKNYNACKGLHCYVAMEIGNAQIADIGVEVAIRAREVGAWGLKLSVDFLASLSSTKIYEPEFELEEGDLGRLFNDDDYDDFEMI